MNAAGMKKAMKGMKVTDKNRPAIKESLKRMGAKRQSASFTKRFKGTY